MYITRNVESCSKAKYFGPFASAGSVRKTLSLIKKLFPYRSWSKTITGNDSRACLDFHINRCVGPCIGAASKEDYGEIIKQVELFLEGNTKQIVNSITDMMNAAALNLEFEKATKLRDQIKIIRTKDLKIIAG